MVSRGGGRLVLWPRYFDSSLTRAQGRRVARDLAVREPDAKWLASAAKKAGLQPEVEEDAAHPSVPYRVVGRVLVTSEDGKEAVLRRVAEQMAKTRAE